jgi:hypothetical protein
MIRLKEVQLHLREEGNPLEYPVVCANSQGADLRIEIKDAGHLPCGEQLDRCTELTCEFIEETCRG